MLQSGAKERIKKKNTNTPLQKKVTFCGPIMATPEQITFGEDGDHGMQWI